MTPQQLVGTAIRMFSITMALFSIPYLSGMPTALRSYGMDDDVLVSLVIGAIYLTVALLSWFFPMVISHKLVPKTSFDNQFSTRPDEVATVGVALLGLWKVVDAAPDLVSYLFQTSLRAGSNSIFDTLGAEGKADIFFILIECWRAFKNDHLCALNFDQAFMGVDYYTAVDKSTRLTGSEAPLFVH